MLTLSITGLSAVLALLATVWLIVLDRAQPRRASRPVGRGAQVVKLTPQYVSRRPSALEHVRAVLGIGVFIALVGFLLALAIAGLIVAAVVLVGQLLG